MKSNSDYPLLPWEEAPTIVASTNEAVVFDPKLAHEAQSAYCKAKGFPHFAPSNGNCWKCGNQIYNKISVEKAGKELISSCPHCCKSYCD